MAGRDHYGRVLSQDISHGPGLHKTYSRKRLELCWIPLSRLNGWFYPEDGNFMLRALHYCQNAGAIEAWSNGFALYYWAPLS